MAKKFYFRNEDDEMCYTLEYHLSNARDEQLNKVILFPAKIEKVSGFFWCRDFDAMCKKGESCGKSCESYEPRNKKYGICKHHGNFHAPGDPVTFDVLTGKPIK